MRLIKHIEEDIGLNWLEYLIWLGVGVFVLCFILWASCCEIDRSTPAQRKTTGVEQTIP